MRGGMTRFFFTGPLLLLTGVPPRANARFAPGTSHGSALMALWMLMQCDALQDKDQLPKHPTPTLNQNQNHSAERVRVGCPV